MDRGYYKHFNNAINNTNFSSPGMPESDLSTVFESASTCSSFDSGSSSRSTSSSLSSYSLCKRNGRRGGIQLKSHGANFTVKNGQWTLWVSEQTFLVLLVFFSSNVIFPLHFFYKISGRLFISMWSILNFSFFPS